VESLNPEWEDLAAGWYWLDSETNSEWPLKKVV
jgi:hypothetical protein